MELKGYRYTSVGLVPEDWHLNTLSQIGSIHGRVGWKGYTVKDLCLSGAYTIGAKHIDKQNRLDLNDPTFLRQEKFLESPEIMVFKDDILIVQRGSIGKVVLIDREIGDATINPSMLILRLKSALPLYVYYYFVSRSGQNQILSDVSSTGVPMITQRQVLAFKIPTPSKAEQTAIATALSDMDALITQTQKLIGKKKAIKQGMMQQLFSPYDEDGKLKAGWSKKKLGEVCIITMGQSPKSISYNQNSIGLPLIQGNADIKDRRTLIRLYTSQITKVAKANDVIMTVRAPVGEVSKTFFDCCLGRGVCAVRYENDFIYHYLISIEKDWSKYSSGSTFDSVNSSQIDDLELYIPVQKSDQEAISKALNEVDIEINGIFIKLCKLRMLKQSMMQSLLTGKIRIYNPEHEPATQV